MGVDIQPIEEEKENPYERILWARYGNISYYFCSHFIGWNMDIPDYEESQEM